ncbi:GDSL-type esterase/lipase family protein [Mucilaginibacter sp. SP1R1]|uniref:GDSL-type esterase/lipase family protein n=1 Tax=Mucilaginibacter sp. SP1R1 TaxID=2723091 RepID=UPI0016197404|nr:GDSL-type esterase/lipase family protein [Mucilaginibacter sp. SP1R1]MBB6148229.1 acetyl esterase/lipase/lysophospholipase L1-like esterase [Mucilaginibacter sp. SP1R1]
MKPIKLTLMLLAFFAVSVKAQQKVIQLYPGAAPGSENWNWTEGESENNAFNTKVIYNVVHPSLGVFLPDASIATGTAVIICPGGGFHTLSINSEGNDEAKWLNQHGVAAFVLKYRVVHSLTNDPVGELVAQMAKKDFEQQVSKVIPLGIADARLAITYVREHAAEYNLSPSRIGIMGFSAGGTLAAASAFNYTPANKPDFVAPVYPYFPPALQSAIPADAPPMFITAATDDNLGLAPHSVNLYTKWIDSKHSAELHMYAKGGHGFGMRKQDLPTDNWIERFNDWLGLKGFLNPIDPKAVSPHEKEQQAENNRKKYDEAFHKDWANIKRYDADNSKITAAADKSKSVVYMGDSITDFWINADPSFWNGKPYYNRGISGQTTTQMLVRFRDDVINLKPSVVVILAGINDIAENNGPIKLEDVFGNIQSMALLAKAAGIKVVLSSVLPAVAFPWRPGMEPALKVERLNAMIKDYANKNHIVYLDYFSTMADEQKGIPKALSGDGVHPNLAGYKVMEPLAEKAIAEALKRK